MQVLVKVIKFPVTVIGAILLVTLAGETDWHWPDRRHTTPKIAPQATRTLAPQ